MVVDKLDNLRRSLRSNALAGIGVLLVLILGLGGWTANTEVSGAIIASGVVTSEGSSKDIEHLEGGIIHKINVKEGDFVTKGFVLAQLDDTESKARLRIVESQLIELSAEQSRLESERDNLPRVNSIRSQFKFLNSERVARAINGQLRFLLSIRESTKQKKKQLSEQISQTLSGINSIEAKLKSTMQQISLIETEIDILKGLNNKGLASRGRLVSMQRERALLEGQAGGFRADISRLKTRISEIKLKSLEIDEERRKQVYSEISENRAKIAQLNEQLSFELIRMRRTQIVSPVDGYVHNLKIHTNNGVAKAGETLMSIIPSKEPHIFRSRVRPIDIDEVRVGQSARIRLKSLKGFLVSELSGVVKTVGADRLQDKNTGETYFNVDVVLDDKHRSDMPSHDLKVGMPADIFVTKENRSVLTYLYKPVSDILSKSLRQ